MNILNQIRDPDFKLSKSAKKVAAAVLQNPEQIIHTSIAKLATSAEVSEPSVIRFCHKDTKAPKLKYISSLCVWQNYKFE